MLSVRFRLVLIMTVIIYFALLYGLIRRKRLLLKYALIWIGIGLVFTILIAFPWILVNGAHLIGIYLDINFLFLFMIGLLMIITMSLTIIVSRLNDTNKKLVQKTAILEAEIEKMKGNM